MRPYRFDLELAISAWRRSLTFNRTFSADDLDELEQHLRDQVAGLVAIGTPEEQAYRQALREMGDQGTAETEYRKVYWGKVLQRRAMKAELQWKLSMLLHDVRLALRGFKRHRLFTFINVTGIAISFAACLLILRYAGFELSYDQFHTNGPDLYRLTNDRFQNGVLTQHGVITYPSVAKALKNDYPEVVNYTRIERAGPSLVEVGDRRFDEDDTIMFADSAFFVMFTYLMVMGDPQTALAHPYTAVLSEHHAARYFGPDWRAQSIIGRSLTIDDRYDVTVTGVFEDAPPNTHMRFGIVISYATLGMAFGDAMEDSWTNSNFWTYLQLAPGTDPDAFEAKLLDFSERHFAGTTVSDSIERFHLQPLRQIHLYSDYEYEWWEHGDGTSVWAMLTIAAFILIIACVNYINLSTARALDRAKEVGIRTIVGAERRDMRLQFLVEAGLVYGFGSAAALALVIASAPLLTASLGITIPRSLPDGWAVALAIALCAGIAVSGLYPSAIVSSFSPMSVLKGKFIHSRRGRALRKGLVIVQFALSFTMITGTFAVYRQLQFMQEQDLGIHLDEILAIDAPRLTAWDSTYFSNIASFKESVLSIPGVHRVTTSRRPGSRLGRIFDARRRGTDSDSVHTIAEMGVDHDFFDTFELKRLAGRFFDATDHHYAFDDIEKIVLNESASRTFGFREPDAAIHSELQFWGTSWEIVGVVGDHHQQSLQVRIEPIVFLPAYSTNNDFFLRVAPAGLPRILEAVRQRYASFFPGNTFDYTFLNGDFNAQYTSDQRFRNLFVLFTGLGILLACLGLLGLSVFATVQRRKEIGVRKVLGASTSSLFALLTGDFVRLVFIATLVAIPPTYVALTQWLATYAYHIDLVWTLFAIPAVSVLLIAVSTVGYQTIRAALADPVESLRYE